MNIISAEIRRKKIINDISSIKQENRILLKKTEDIIKILDGCSSEQLNTILSYIKDLHELNKINSEYLLTLLQHLDT